MIIIGFNFINNSATTNGSVIQNDSSNNMAIMNSSFVNNATSNGGTVYNSGGSSPVDNSYNQVNGKYIIYNT